MFDDSDSDDDYSNLTKKKYLDSDSDSNLSAKQKTNGEKSSKSYTSLLGKVCFKGSKLGFVNLKRTG